MPRSKFQAPRTVSDFQQVETALRQIQEALDTATASRAQLQVHLSDFALVAGDFHRASSQTSGTLNARLPAASGDNVGQPIVVHLENMVGSFKIHASPGQTVNGQTSATFDQGGVVVLWSNGVDAWSGVNQVPAESPAGEALDAEYIVAASNTSLPNAHVATDSTEIDVTTSAGVASWALKAASVVLSKLADLTGLSVLGRASNSAGVMAAITATGSRQALMSNSAGTAIGWRSLELADLPTLPTPDWADVLAEDVSSGANNPSIASGQHLAFAGGGLSGGDIRSAAGLRLAAGTFFHARSEDVAEIDAATNIELRTNNTLRVTITQTGELELSNDPGASGQVLTSSGANNPPTWATVDLSSVTYTAGDGLDLTTLEFSVDVSDFAGTGLEDDGSNNLRIATAAAGNGLTGGGGSALAVGGSTSVIVGANDVQRAALTGDVTASQNSNVTTIANEAVTNAKMANMSPGTVKGLQLDAGASGAPQDLTGTEVTELLRWNTNQVLNVAGDNSDIAIDAITTNLRFSNGGATGLVRSIVAPTTEGQRAVLCMSTGGGDETIVVDDPSQTAENRVQTPGGIPYRITAEGGHGDLVHNQSRNRWTIIGPAGGDYDATRIVDENFEANVLMTMEGDGPSVPSFVLNSWRFSKPSGDGTASVSTDDNQEHHVGVLRLTTGNSSSDKLAFWLARDVITTAAESEATVDADQLRYFRFVFRVTNTSIAVLVGFGTDFTDDSEGGTNVIALRVSTATTGGVWLAVTKGGSSPHSVNTGVSLGTGWNQVEVYKYDDLALFYINRVLVHAEFDVPTGSGTIGGYVQTLTGATRALLLDRVMVDVQNEALD